MNPPTGTFPVTDWSLIDRVSGDEDSAARRLSMDELLRRYFPPMRRFLQYRFSIDEHTADDWVQGFSTSKLLQSELLRRADRDQGRFRALLSRALSDYAIDQTRRARAAKKHAGRPVDAKALEALESSDGDPTRSFEQHWAEHAIREALQRTEERLKSSNRSVAWEIFRRRLLEPSASDRSYAALAKEFRFAKPSQATVALRTAKRVFRRKLKDVLIEFGGAEGDLAAKVAELRRIFEN